MEETTAMVAAEILRFFDCSHLSDELRDVAEPFRDLAQKLEGRWEGMGQRNRELETALRKLLEAKDAAVRARIADKEHAAACAEWGVTGAA